MADQLRPQALSAYGNAIVDAPNLAALGMDGVVFDRAYCNSPICAPSRASMMTGLLPSRIGVYDNGAEFPASVPTLAHKLRARSYRTVLAGKMHFIGPDQLHGFEERLTTDVYPAGLDWTPDWTRPLEDRLPWYHDMSSVTDAGSHEATLQTDYDEEVSFRAVRAIKDLARSDDGRPFFLLVSFIHPHDPWEVPADSWRRYEGVEVDPPEVPAIPDARLDPHSRRIRAMCGADHVEISDDAVLNARRAYYAAVSYLDDRIGEVLAALDATGLRESTVVMFTADHGEMLGERGLWYKMAFFEPSARVPLIVHAPGRFAPRWVPRNVSLIDVMPTVTEMAGDGQPLVPVGQTDGVSLVPLLRGEDVDTPDVVLGEYLAEGAVAPVVMILRGPLKYVHCPDDPDQLYDLMTDPTELTNLATSPDRADIVTAFREEVAARWDLEQLGRDVEASQRHRRLVQEALSVGRRTDWDYRPPDGSADRYVRGGDFWGPVAAARLGAAANHDGTERHELER